MSAARAGPARQAPTCNLRAAAGRQEPTRAPAAPQTKHGDAGCGLAVTSNLNCKLRLLVKTVLTSTYYLYLYFRFTLFKPQRGQTESTPSGTCPQRRRDRNPSSPSVAAVVEHEPRGPSSRPLLPCLCPPTNYPGIGHSIGAGRANPSAPPLIRSGWAPAATRSPANEQRPADAGGIHVWSGPIPATGSTRHIHRTLRRRIGFGIPALFTLARRVLEAWIARHIIIPSVRRRTAMRHLHSREQRDAARPPSFDRRYPEKVMTVDQGDVP